MKTENIQCADCDYLNEIKKNSEDGNRLIAKLMMNSLYGKTVSQADYEKFIYADTDSLYSVETKK